MKKHKELSALLVFFLCLILLFANGCQADHEDQLTDYLNNPDYPQDYWETSTPSAGVKAC